MSDLIGAHALDWIVRFTMLGAVAYAVVIIHSEQARTTRLVDRTLCRRLAELLPLPRLGDRGTLMAMLRDIAPGHDLALYTAGESALLIARRPPLEPPGPEEARWMEVHRAALQAGQVVREQECGALVPLRLRDGTLTGALVVGTHKRCRSTTRPERRCVTSPRSWPVSPRWSWHPHHGRWPVLGVHRGAHHPRRPHRRVRRRRAVDRGRHLDHRAAPGRARGLVLCARERARLRQPGRDHASPSLAPGWLRIVRD